MVVGTEDALRGRGRLRQVADLGQAVLVGRRLGDDEAVLVGGLGRVQRRETLWLQRRAQRVARRHGIIRRLPGAFVDELKRGGRVLGEHVDLTRLEGREDDLAVAELELAFDCRAVALEHLGEDLAQDLLLREVGRADGDVAFEPGADSRRSSAR